MPHRSASERPGAGAQDDDARREVIAWLGSAAAYPALSAGQRAEGVRRYETHGALVFAAGDDVYKIKRAVRFPYLDFSTLELRERVIRREFEINKPNAPELYLGVVAVTRGDDGQLQLGGCGTPVEWALHMRRFRDADLLSAVAARGGIDRALALRIADAVAAAHERAEVIEGQDGGAGLAQVLEQVIAGLAAERDALDAATVGRFGEVSRAALAGVTPLLDRRAAEGRVRRCHGDLHLGNIVLWGGRPLLFDALEFDDRLASVDTLYDVAFLLMDLDVGGHRVTANLILNRIVSGPRGATEIDGFAALPLMLALRAAIRAMVGAERADQEYGDARTTAVARARGYLGQAISYLAPAAPMLVAVGGFSGTGKSTLAAALAPGIGGAPGALHIRADVERKAMFGVDEGARLQPAAYAAEVSPRVYAAMMDKARRALAAGHSVVIDAVFSRPGERVAAEAAAASVGTPFKGLWLEARRDVLVARVERRSGDASDATPDVVAGQLARGAGDVFWTTVEAGGTAESTLTAARRVLGLK